MYGKSGFPPKNIDNWTDPFADLDSVFNHMSDEVFENPVHPEKMIEYVFQHLITEDTIKKVFIDGERPEEADPKRWFNKLKKS